jgi:hypothetical protein
VDRVFGAQEVRLKCLSDAAGVLRKKERELAGAVLEEFQRKFPQLFFAVYLGSFRELPSLRQFGFWLLNRGAFEDVDLSRPNEAGILLSVDVGGKSAGISFGYILQPYLDDENTFGPLSAAHPYLLQEQYLQAIEVVVGRMTKILKRQSRRARRDSDRFIPVTDTKGPEERDSLKRIRANHRSRQPKV